ncbi:response regulator [Paenibacillus alkaliterrae]|uniref:response regulator n=1 Tax=Paenibacillus alkaliterrae TaxID=320909 RepID=UPI001F3358F2|nr:response regulator [Paenibacillus alkaliterrae]MCF2941706.1 response regulator [Paenibacillus alkaliterrae]
MKLLIADDQLSLHKFLNKMIDWTSLGITDVTHAYNGREAAEMTEAIGPDLLIIDIHMPEWNGIEALKRIQRLDKKPKTIILSAYDQFEYAKEALRLNVSQYMLKPVDAAQMKDVLTEFIGDIRKETRALAIRELEMAIGVEHYSEPCLSAVKRAFEAHGLCSFAAITVRVPRSERSWPDLQLETPEEMELFPLATREGGEELRLLAGLRRESDDAWLLSQSEGWLASWRKRYPELSFALGLSGIEADMALLPKRMEESRAAAKQIFYEPNAVFCYREDGFADGAVLRDVRQEALQLEEKLRKGYDTEAMRERIDEFLLSAKQRRVEPDVVCELSHRLLFVFCGSAAGTEGDERDEFITLQSFRHACSTFDGLMAAVMEKAGAHMSDMTAALPQHACIRQIKKYVDANCEADLSLQTVADRFDIDRFRLSREFKLEWGENYWTYVTRIRMEQAAAYLKETNWRNGMIAERTGYCDESHFSRAFKKHFGLSPREYRSAAAERND